MYLLTELVLLGAVFGSQNRSELDLGLLYPNPYHYQTHQNLHTFGECLSMVVFLVLFQSYTLYITQDLAKRESLTKPGGRC